VIDEMIHIPEWMYKTAEAIASMPFRAEFYERDIAVQIAKHIPSVHRRGAGLPCGVDYIRMMAQFREKRRQDMQDIRSRRIEQGLCWRCGKVKEQTKKRMCNAHLLEDKMRKESRLGR
jgi:hypothetical protein